MFESLVKSEKALEEKAKIKREKRLESKKRKRDEEEEEMQDFFMQEDADQTTQTKKGGPTGAKRRKMKRKEQSIAAAAGVKSMEVVTPSVSESTITIASVPKKHVKSWTAPKTPKVAPQKAKMEE